MGTSITTSTATESLLPLEVAFRALKLNLPDSIYTIVYAKAYSDATAVLYITKMYFIIIYLKLKYTGNLTQKQNGSSHWKNTFRTTWAALKLIHNSNCLVRTKAVFFLFCYIAHVGFTSYRYLLNMAFDNATVFSYQQCMAMCERVR